MQQEAQTVVAVYRYLEQRVGPPNQLMNVQVMKVANNKMLIVLSQAFGTLLRLVSKSLKMQGI